MVARSKKTVQGDPSPGDVLVRPVFYAGPRLDFIGTSKLAVKRNLTLLYNKHSDKIMTKAVQIAQISCRHVGQSDETLRGHDTKETRAKNAAAAI